MTRVVFRAWKSGGGVIALFPDTDKGERYGRGWDMVGSYEHIGQHGDADYGGVIAATRPATPDEYEPLRRELEGAPFHYRLKVCRRRPRQRAASEPAAAGVTP